MVGEFSILSSLSWQISILDLGFNRKIHLDMSSILTIGFVPMPLGVAGFQISIPNDPGLRGTSLYLQAGVLHGTAPVHVTNSCQLTVR